MDNGESSYRRFLEGDKSAFDAILRLYLDSLVFFVDRYVRDIYTAEDIAIDVFTYVLMHPQRYNFKSSLKSYLFMLGRCKAIDHLRRRSRLQQVELNENECADFKSLEETLIESERKRALSSAIEALPQDMRAAVHLVHFEGLSYEEAGAVLKKNQKQIGNLLYRAKRALKESLVGEEF